MEKNEEKDLKKNNESLDETIIINNLDEIIKAQNKNKNSSSNPNNKVIHSNQQNKSKTAVKNQHTTEQNQNQKLNAKLNQNSKPNYNKQTIVNKQPVKNVQTNQNIQKIQSQKLNNEVHTAKNKQHENSQHQIQKENQAEKKHQEQQVERKQLIVKEAQKIVDQTAKKEHKNKKSKTILKVLLIILFLVLCGIIFSTIFSLININNNNIMDGIIVNDINISNYSKKDAKELLNNTINNGEKNYVTVYREGVTDQISLKDINGEFDVENIVNEAYKIGREGNIVECNYDILFTKLLKKSMTANLKYDEELLDNKIKEISLKMPDLALDSSYAIVDNNVVIKNSTEGYRINKEEFKKELIKSLSSNTKTFEIKVEKTEKEEINIEKIYKEVYKEAKNAYYTTNPHKIYKEEKGLDFAISLEEAKKLLLEDKNEYTIPLKVLEPAITVKDLDKGAFPDTLGTFTTYYGTGDAGRCYNIYLAAKSINETIVMPGETFSYNDLIGECSTRTGYRESTIYLNGKLAKGIGGGICQGSTTLYNAVLRANLEIVERRNHSLSVTYVPLGQDAMVSIGSSDFKFKNNRDYPIKVIATTGTGSITCQIQGLKNETEYEVKLQTNIISKTALNTKTQTYKILYLNGKEVSRTLLSTDSYKNH